MAAKTWTSEAVAELVQDALVIVDRWKVDPLRLALARSDFIGSSLNWEIWLRRARPDLVVPEYEVTMVEGPPVKGACPDGACPACHGRITEGSLRYCPVCQASGFEAELAEQRKLAGLPPKELKVQAKGAGKKSRRQRRAEERAAAAAEPRKAG